MKHFHINSLWIYGLFQAFTKAGLDLEELARGMANLDGKKLKTGCQLDLVDARTLWHRAAHTSLDPLLGVKVGNFQNPRSMGALLPIVMHSPTARIALEHIANLQVLISESGRYRIRNFEAEGVQFIECEYVPASCPMEINPHQVLSILTGTIRLLEELSSNTIGVDTLYIPPELNAEAIGQSLTCRAVTREGNLSILIRADQIDDEIPSRDERLYQISLSYAEGLMRTHRVERNFLSKVKSMIDTELPALVGITEVALALGIHRRILQRALADQGTSFRQLKQRVLKDRSIDMLISKRLEVELISEKLGYSDTSAFYRAFRSWFNATPKQFRELIAF